MQGVDFVILHKTFVRLSVAGGDAQNFASKLYTAIFYIESYPFVPFFVLPKLYSVFYPSAGRPWIWRTDLQTAL